MNTAIPLWVILVLVGVAWGACAVQSWLAGQYEFFWFGVRRRWYGTRAHVVFRGTEDEDDPLRFAVLAWCDDNTPTPWLYVHKLNPEFLTYWDEDSEAFWAPVTDFAPYSVRKVRPSFRKAGPVPVPWLTKYLPLRNPSRYLEGAR